MKARRKSDGEIIKVEAIVYNAKNGERYSPLELDFNVNAEETVISGWVARDKDGELALFQENDKPSKMIERGFWSSDFGRMGRNIPDNLFPNFTWDDDPIEVELIIKRKNK